MTDDADLALQALIAAMKETAPKLDEELLRKCYDIQKKYQFSDDRSLSLAAMERLVDAKVAQLADQSGT